MIFVILTRNVLNKDTINSRVKLQFLYLFSFYIWCWQTKKTIICWLLVVTSRSKVVYHTLSPATNSKRISTNFQDYEQQSLEMCKQYVWHSLNFSTSHWMLALTTYHFPLKSVYPLNPQFWFILFIHFFKDILNLLTLLPVSGIQARERNYLK